MGKFVKPFSLYGILFLIITSIFFILSLRGNATPDKYAYFGVVILLLAWSLVPALIVASLYYWQFNKTLRWLFIILNVGIILFLIAGGLMSGASSSSKLGGFFGFVILLALTNFIIYMINKDLTKAL